MFFTILLIFNTGGSAADISPPFCTTKLAPFPTWSAMLRTCYLEAPKRFVGLTEMQCLANKTNDTLAPATPITSGFPERGMSQLHTELHGRSH